MNIIQTINTLPTEEWRPIPEWEERYAVSSLGRVASLPTHKCFSIKYLRPFPHGRPPYMTVGLVDSLNERKKQRKVHGLVASAFIGLKPAGKLVCHNDGNIWNNHVSNLRYDTPSANTIDRKLHRTARITSKLTTEDVEEIKGLKKYGIAAEGVAKHFGVDKSTIQRIWSGKTHNTPLLEFNNLDVAKTQVLEYWNPDQ